MIDIRDSIVNSSEIFEKQKKGSIYIGGSQRVGDNLMRFFQSDGVGDKIHKNKMQNTKII